MTTDAYAWAADGVLLVHAAFVLFILGGQVSILLGWWRDWRWTRGLVFRAMHLLAIGFVVLEAWFGVVCPLTVLESRLRLSAGQAAYDLSFIGHWVQRLLFYAAPDWVFTLIYSMFTLLVVASFVLYPPRRNGRWKARSKDGE